MSERRRPRVHPQPCGLRKLIVLDGISSLNPFGFSFKTQLQKEVNCPQTSYKRTQGAVSRSECGLVHMHVVSLHAASKATISKMLALNCA